MKPLMLDIRKNFASNSMTVVFGFDDGGGIYNHNITLDGSNPPFFAADLYPENVHNLIYYLNEYLKGAENGDSEKTA